MTRWQPQKADTLAALATEILHNYSRGRAIVAVDGVDGAGKTHFADALAEAIRSQGHAAVRASLDGFHRPRAERYARGRDSPEGFYRDSYDYGLVRSLLIEPFRRGGDTEFVPAAFDVRSDSPVTREPTTAPADAILVVDGIFAHRAELRGSWNYSIWLDVSPDVATERLRERDGEAGVSARYTDGQALYVKDANPRAAASAIVDNTDFEHPRRVFADSC